MKRMIFATAALALTLAGCTFTTGSLTSPGSLATPAGVTHLNDTAIDDQALRIGWSAYDTTLDVVDALVASGTLVKGTPRALAVKDVLIKILHGLTAASAAQRAGSATDYATAIAEATDAMREFRTAIR